jgi:hypothetical protein
MQEINEISTIEPVIRRSNCHYCKKLMSVATVPEVIGFCNMGCAENWKKETRKTVIGASTKAYEQNPMKLI